MLEHLVCMAQVRWNLFCVSVLLSIVSSAQSHDFSDESRQMRIDVAYLASDFLGGRASGTPMGREAAAYIAERMSTLGFVGVGDSSGFHQEFDIRVAGHGMGEATPLHGQNVLGYLDQGAATTLVIGAHYDHLGFGGPGSGSLSTAEPAPHNGADDNASGVAVMLDLAERLAADTAGHRYNYLLAAFDAEEMGLVGSKYLASHLPPGLSVAAMLNFDMVGRLRGDGVLAVNGTGTSPLWMPLLDSVASGRTKLRPYDSGLGPSDHASFYLLDLPVLHFFTGQHAQYHKPEDDMVLVDFAGMQTVSNLVYDLIKRLPPSEQLPFSKTVDQSQATMTDFKVTLGIMPDYVYDGTGLRIDGVLADRPAATAGLLKGDIVVKLDAFEIKDIYDYMKALGEFEESQRVNIVVNRDGELLRKRVTF